MSERPTLIAEGADARPPPEGRFERTRQKLHLQPKSASGPDNTGPQGSPNSRAIDSGPKNHAVNRRRALLSAVTKIADVHGRGIRSGSAGRAAALYRRPSCGSFLATDRARDPRPRAFNPEPARI